MHKLITTIMKRILQLLTLCAMCFLTGSIGYASNDKDEKKPTIEKPIIVTQPSLIHRSLEAPIYAYYAAGTITLEFVENLGAATVAVQNLTTGGQVAELIDSAIGNAVIDIENILTVGDYYMTITTISGDIYYADFSLE